MLETMIIYVRLQIRKVSFFGLQTQPKTDITFLNPNKYF